MWGKGKLSVTEKGKETLPLPLLSYPFLLSLILNPVYVLSSLTAKSHIIYDFFYCGSIYVLRTNYNVMYSLCGLLIPRVNYRASENILEQIHLALPSGKYKVHLDLEKCIDTKRIFGLLLNWKWQAKKKS